MKVFNLTDIPTKVLEQRGLVKKTIVVGRELVNPGESTEIEDTPRNRGRLQDLLRFGAVAIDKLPPTYAQAYAKEHPKPVAAQPVLAPKPPSTPQVTPPPPEPEAPAPEEEAPVVTEDEEPKAPEESRSKRRRTRKKRTD